MSAGPSLVAIGNFDGVHRGHRAVIERAVGLARQQSLAPLVLTFHPHPSQVLGRGSQPMLTPIERKVELLCRIDPALAVVVEPFTLELSRHTPREFVERLLIGALSARLVIVGQNFRFGHKRAGDLAVLGELGKELGLEARAEQLSGDEHGRFSSTRVREAVAAGDLAAAESVLGRPHALSGTVVEGDRRGRSIGFPTANLAHIREALPPHGVYACAVDRLDADGAAPLAGGVANLGVRPTVGAGASFEVHLFDFDGDLYGKQLRVHLLARLRDEKKFDGLEQLKQQIARDAQAARAVVASRPRDPAASGWF